MALSDDEDEALPMSVSNYSFVDDKDEHASFADLPIQWTEGDRTDGKKEKLFLLGNVDGGLQSIHKHVVAWKFDLSKVVKPEISVLSKENIWMKLEKPRKFFEVVIRSIMVTVQCLHYVRRNPEASGTSLWDHLSKIFRSFEVSPSKNDLECHTSLITKAVERNDALAKSKFLAEFLKKEPKSRGLSNEGVHAKPMSNFIVSDSDDDIIDCGEDGESDEADELFDYACAICDNGGDLLCCEGSCLRSFHACAEAADDCDTLGYTEEEANALTSQTAKEFLCKNCDLKRHQCFICGKLGSSDTFSGAEVFRCVSATCGQFYHPHCVAKMLYKDNKVPVEEQRIAKGGSFVCPVHKCRICKQGENKKDPQLQFAVCRRCPTSYHRKCMPKKILFETNEEEGIPQRAWEDLLPNRILIYCLAHKIDEELGTPARDHIKFPGDEEKKSTLATKKTSIVEKRHKQTSESIGDRKKIESKPRVYSEEPRQERTTSALKQTKKSSSALKPAAGNKSSGKLASGSGISRKVKVNDVARKELKSTRSNENKTSLGERLFAHMNGSSEPENIENEDHNTAVFKRDTNLSSGLPPLDADSEKRVLGIMESAKSSITITAIRATKKIPSIHGSSQKLFDEKSISQGKVETSVQAVREALRILDEGGCIEDAEEVCSRDLLAQIFKWRNKLKLHITPFLHGNRYTSYGRHFTKVEKLDEIVNRLHWYLQDGDMLVDFCCGLNDFSVLMKEKLDEMGKTCSFKNYDIFPPKNYFNFEQRDWMSVKRDELATGSKLVMGLNPPFGFKAKTLIDKALEFNPKLLILIVPSESQRLDENDTPYDLIWEDGSLLSGKSFYLPGSIDARDKQMEQWNIWPPPLCLWSHPDWSAKHRSIAKTQGHISKLAVDSGVGSHHGKMIADEPTGNHDDGDHDVYNLPMGGNADCANVCPLAIDEHGLYGGNLMLKDYPVEVDNLNGYADAGFGTEGRKESSPSGGSYPVSPRSHNPGKKPFGERSRKRQRKAKKNKRGSSGRVLPDKRQAGGRPPVGEIHDTGIPSYNSERDNIYRHPEPYIPVRIPAPIPSPHARHNYDNGTGSRSPVREICNPRMPLYTGVDESIHQYPDPSIPVSHVPQHAYDGSMDRRYLANILPVDPSAVADYGVRTSDIHHFTQQAIETTDDVVNRYLDKSTHLYGGHHRPYGQQDPSLPASSYLPTPGMIVSRYAPLSSGYGPMGMAPAPEPLYRRPRDARSDEPHPNRMSSFGSEPVPPTPFGNGGSYPPGFGAPRPPNHGPTGGSSAFAPGLHDNYQHHSSGGWIS